VIAGTTPTPQRHQHDRVTRDAETLADAAGSIGLPYRVESLLGRLERHGDITAAQRHAGEEFGRLFALAHLDPIRAADMAHGDRTGSAAANHGSERARRRVLTALDALGGQGSPCGSAAWFILGCEYSVRAWALREGWGGKPLREHVAKGTLIGTLGVLAKHFGI
jgi:hypothetical protein